MRLVAKAEAPARAAAIARLRSATASVTNRSPGGRAKAQSRTGSRQSTTISTGPCARARSSLSSSRSSRRTRAWITVGTVFTTMPPSSPPLRVNDQRADHSRGAVAGDGTIKGVGARLHRPEQGEGALAARHRGVDVQLIDVETVGEAVAVLLP